MSLNQARNILIRKLKARVLEIYREHPNIANEQTLESESWYALIAHYEKLERKVALEQTPAWLSNITKENNFNASTIWVTPTAYKQIIEAPNNLAVKSIVEKAICFSLHNCFKINEPETLAFNNPNCIGTNTSESPLAVKVIWQKGLPETKTIFIAAFPVEPCRLSPDSKILKDTLKRCLPLSAI